jgi:hypothetical protein
MTEAVRNDRARTQRRHEIFKSIANADARIRLKKTSYIIDNLLSGDSRPETAEQRRRNLRRGFQSVSIGNLRNVAHTEQAGIRG